MQFDHNAAERPVVQVIRKAIISEADVWRPVRRCANMNRRVGRSQFLPQPAVGVQHVADTKVCQDHLGAGDEMEEEEQEQTQRMLARTAFIELASSIDT